jgi:transposase InsO family protein
VPAARAGSPTISHGWTSSSSTSSAIRLNARPDAATVMAELDSWFEDYNEMHPHCALGMRSPRQFVRAQQPATCPV